MLLIIARTTARRPWLPASPAAGFSTVGGVGSGDGGAARKKAREAEDEACLFNAAWGASQDTLDAFPARLGQDPAARKHAIDTHVARQVALLLGSLSGPGARYRPGVPPPGLEYAVEVVTSPTVPEAGRGLVVRGRAKAGDLIGFYPGTVYTAPELALCGGLAAAMASAGNPSGDYMCGRAGGVLVDGLGSGFEVDPVADPALYAALALRDGDDADSSSVGCGGGGEGAAVSERGDAWPLPPGLQVAGQPNGWANGHFANHPPRGRSANVVKWPYDFPPQLPARLLPLVPNAYALLRKPADPAMAARPRLSKHTLVLVAAVDLEDGDECFLDYGFGECFDEAGHEAELSSSGGGGGVQRPAWLVPAALRGDVLVDPAVDEEARDGEAGGEGSRGAKAKKPPCALEVAKGELLAWRAAFEEASGKAPTRNDIAADPVAAGLFAEFSRLSKLEWEE